MLWGTSAGVFAGAWAPGGICMPVKLVVGVLLASYVDDDVGWVVPLWRDDDPASSLSRSVKTTQNRNYSSSFVKTLEKLFLLKSQLFLVEKLLPPHCDTEHLTNQITYCWF